MKCSGDWSTQTTAAAVEKLRERGVEVELSCGRAEGGGIVLASCFSFAREMREVRLGRYRRFLRFVSRFLCVSFSLNDSRRLFLLRSSLPSEGRWILTTEDDVPGPHVGDWEIDDSHYPSEQGPSIDDSYHPDFEIRMGFPKKLGKWIAEKAQKNKIKVLQDVIDKLNKLVLFQKLKVLTYGGKTDDHTVIALFSNLKNRGHGSRDDPEGREESLGRMEHSCSHNLQSLTPSDPCRLLAQQKTHIRQALRLPHMVRLPSRRLFLKEAKFEPVIPPVRIDDGEGITYEKATNALRRGVAFFSALQASDGHWPGENGGPLFLLPPLNKKKLLPNEEKKKQNGEEFLQVFCLYVTGHLEEVFNAEHYKEMLRYIYCHQNEDGGWGLHIESSSFMFTTVLNYICLRILGVGPEGGRENACRRAREWILNHGGVTYIPSWGKVWLSILGIYDWSGTNPMPPELWLLPSCLPIHLGKLLCHTRMVYMPMSYLYGKRFVGPITPLIMQLREELYLQPYEEINWNKARRLYAKEDMYYPHPLIQDLIWDTLYMFVEPFFTRWPLNRIVREKALRVAMKHIHYEDEKSHYHWKEFKFLQGSGSQLWETAFAMRALLASNLGVETFDVLRRRHSYIKKSQVRENPPGDFKSMYHRSSKGAWTFSDRDHGWQVSDRTAEALKCCMLLSAMPADVVGQKIDHEHLCDSVNLLLSLQSDNGGFTAWEPACAPEWLELLNPTEFFANVMAVREYLECTSSVIQALVMVKQLYPDYRNKEIIKSMEKAVQFIESKQVSDGSWYGNWGICFIYGTWFALSGLAAVGKTYNNCLSMQKGVDFLLGIQNEDGGWGESYLSCPEQKYIPLQGNASNLVQTSWAMLGLINAGQADRDVMPLHHAAKFIITSQMESGDFPQQEIVGAFMNNCMIHYATFRNTFPLWALAEYRKAAFVTLQD
ncbi:hypothetical protein DY000_02005558 [Brassica cretica]|uniref:Terpene cyclase/mutase family member n=1 Tax=Brassica cretica TaxID=69181 RepID=A0ABQ7C6K5_BRACR|nr:hypothetical protein DY000_02005558 [Brassica cretica]